MHFNVGNYRRRDKGEELQDASFFDHHNPVRGGGGGGAASSC